MLQQENVYPKGQADPDNHRPGKWNSTVRIASGLRDNVT